MASTRIEDCRRASHSRDEERHVELWTKLIPAALEDGSRGGLEKGNVIDSRGWGGAVRR